MSRRRNFTAAALITVSFIVIAAVIFFSVGSRNNRENDVAEQIVGEGLPGIEEIIKVEPDVPEVVDSPQTAEVNDMGESPAEIQQAADSVEASGQIEAAAQNNVAQETSAQTLVDTNKMVNPVGSNAVTMSYSLNGSPVYSKTLAEYRSDHRGIDLKADFGAPVNAAYEGKVVSIHNDQSLGLTIRLEHGGNIFTEYANLDPDSIAVSIGQTVEQGSQIANVGRSAVVEISDPGHLHFALLIRDIFTDPAPYLGIK
ncbi:MAG: M23 family metallopeptidase [Eubacteriaceae bacterium]|nr:M23 family metallopeptidase [Eubacteriaceae bacterium]